MEINITTIEVIENIINFFPRSVDICFPWAMTGIIINKKGMVTNGENAAKKLHAEKTMTGVLSKYLNIDSKAKNDIINDNREKKTNPKNAKNLCLRSYMINTSVV